MVRQYGRSDGNNPVDIYIHPRDESPKKHRRFILAMGASHRISLKKVSV